MVVVVVAVVVVVLLFSPYYGCCSSLLVLASACPRYSPAVTKAAAFCVGNLVRGCRENARALAAAGGVERLIDVMNDYDDDQTSKKVHAPSIAADVA